MFSVLFQIWNHLNWLVWKLPIRPQLKRNLIKFLIRGLLTRDKLAHFMNQDSSCQLCHQEKELQTHLLEECSVAEGLLQAIGRKYILLNVSSWQETKNVCGLVSKFLTRQETSVVSVALLSLWLTVCAEGLKSLQYATEIFGKILRKNKILPWPPRTQTKKGKRRKVLNLKVFKCFMTVQDVQTLNWRVWALQFSGKGKRYVVVLKLSLLGPTILVSLQAA